MAIEEREGVAFIGCLCAAVTKIEESNLKWWGSLFRFVVSEGAWLLGPVPWAAHHGSRSTGGEAICFYSKYQLVIPFYSSIIILCILLHALYYVPHILYRCMYSSILLIHCSWWTSAFFPVWVDNEWNISEPICSGLYVEKHFLFSCLNTTSGLLVVSQIHAQLHQKLLELCDLYTHR